MFNLFIQLYFLFIHWIADFVLQTDSQAKGKSTSIKMLLKHTVTYGLCILAASYYLQAWDMFGAQYWYASLLFTLVQFVSHTIIDYFTSKINKKLWESGDTHTFFIVVGLGQLMHTLILLISHDLIYN